jgi:hypothetical protein
MISGPYAATASMIWAKLADDDAGKGLALSGRPVRRRADARAGRRDHPREGLSARPRGAALFAASVETTSFEERADGSALRIEQTIYVERESQRPIVLGKGGQTLKWIGQKSREELCDILDRKVHLFLHVKVKENWAEERGLFNDMGLDFDV